MAQNAFFFFSAAIRTNDHHLGLLVLALLVAATPATADVVVVDVATPLVDPTPPVATITTVGHHPSPVNLAGTNASGTSRLADNLRQKRGDRGGAVDHLVDGRIVGGGGGGRRGGG